MTVGLDGLTTSIAEGDVDWASEVNGNWSAIDTPEWKDGATTVFEIGNGQVGVGTSPSSLFRLRSIDTGTDGIGLYGSNNGYTTYFADGAGVEAFGYSYGVMASALRSGDYNQAGGYFDNGEGGYAYVALQTSGGTDYKIYGSGSVSSVMKTSQGERTLHAPETPGAHLMDFGSGMLAGGKAHVDLDPLFRECVTVDAQNPYQVFVTPGDVDNPVKVANKTATGFDVVEVGGQSNAPFDWQVVAKWKGKEHLRFEEGPGRLPTKQA